MYVLQQISSIPGLRDELQPQRIGRSSRWAMASASAPNKKVEKPDDRRPIVDRSRWPTSVIDTPVARSLDWFSATIIPEHLHTDIQRTDRFPSLLTDFNDMEPNPCVSGKVGGDLKSCFTNIPQELSFGQLGHFTKLAFKVTCLHSRLRSAGVGVPFGLVQFRTTCSTSTFSSRWTTSRRSLCTSS